METAASFWSSEDKLLEQLITEFVEAVLDVSQWLLIRNHSEDIQIKVNASYQVKDASTKAHNANQMILAIIKS
ncbi:hypothetical protein [Paenibacillus brevis]|uniref:hypothetical protein n=1 Tax=Paenibacillus brevis TaxID=2841508 RepID=UPI001C0F86B8|nr:hypothetical protein [Paenibacillus brevis]